MGSMWGNWPSYDPHNFSQLKPSDSSHPSKLTPTTYHPTHNRTTPPANQVITTEATNILLRQFYQRAEEKLRLKRSASEPLVPEHGSKHQKGCQSDDPGTGYGRDICGNVFAPELRGLARVGSSDKDRPGTGN